ncbi:hypothetical protein RYX36_023558, partial [Vicia faba]
SKTCHIMHWRFGHKDECVEIVSPEDHGIKNLTLLIQESCKYSLKEEDEGDVYYIEGGENRDELIKETARRKFQDDGCAVCGNSCSKKCSRCKTIKYCSQTCQHFDWKSGHKLQCCVKKKIPTQEITNNQKWHASEN